MNRLKSVVVLILCVLITFAFVGCGGHIPVLDKESIEYDLDYYQSLRQYSLFYEYDLIVENTGKYTVEYDIVLLTSGNSSVATKHISEDITIDRDDVKKGVYHTSGLVYFDSSDPSASKAEITNCVVYEKSVEEDDTGYYVYALVFGLLAVLMLAGVIVCFVIVKYKEKK